MRVSRLFFGSLIFGGVLTAAALSTNPEPIAVEYPVARPRAPARISQPRCPPPTIAPSCYPGATRKYILWDNR